MFIENNKKNIKIIFLVLGLVLLIGAAYQARTYYNISLKAVDAKDIKQVNVEIPVSSSTANISQILYDNSLIRNKTIFNYKVKKMESGGYLKAGNYNLNTGMSLDQIIKQIQSGVSGQGALRFTIPEGYEIRQMADKLEAEGLVDADKFLQLASNKNNFEEKYSFLKELDDGQSLEGFLFPSTYEIFRDSTEEEIIEKMLSGFETIYKKHIEGKLEEEDLSFNEIITLASIVEREAKKEDERDLISAVFHNRLKTDMSLQSCATVQYILGERKEVLTNKDTRIESPYNTYINAGLPPSPIASPGESSILATLNPADVDYLFFRLTGEDGTHTFTTNYQDHLNAKPKN